MAVRIIDNKKIDMTQDEWSMYQKIVKSYTTMTNRGDDLVIDLVESAEQGIIMFLKPCSTRQTSFEVYLFLMSLMQHQHLRQMHAQIDEVVAMLKEKLNSKK